MKRIELTCADCGLKRFSFGRNERCNPCATKEKYKGSRQKIIDRLNAFEDISDIQYAGLNEYNKTTIIYKHRCGAKQEWTLSNIRKQLDKDSTIAPCSVCGAKRRTDAATKAYIAKYGIDESRLDEWETYRKLVRRLTEKTYRLNKDIINPLNLKRGVFEYHLDHKLPIIEGFLQGLPPAQLAAIDNLQMLTSTQNLSKSRFV